MRSFAFGDVFQYGDNEFIFLVDTEDVTYAARILNKELTKLLIKGTETAVRRNSRVIDNLTYSFVELQTQELKERAAHFLMTGKDKFDGSIYTPLNIILCEEDLKAIKEEITSKKCVSIKLKELVKDIKI